MKALNEDILMVLFVLLLEREFVFLEMKRKGVTNQMKALNEDILMVLFALLLEIVYFLAFVKLFLDGETVELN